jgi:hypothetical protein
LSEVIPASTIDRSLIEELQPFRGRSRFRYSAPCWRDSWVFSIVKTVNPVAGGPLGAPMRFPRLPSLLCSLAFVVGALCAPAASAVPVQVDITGTVTGIDNHAGLGFSYAPFLNLAIGDTVTGSWVYDTSTPFGVVPISGSPLGYFIESMSFSTGGGFGAFANFTDSGLASFMRPASGHVFPDHGYSVSLQFAPNYFDAIPPSALDTSALLFGSIFGSYAMNPSSFMSYTADVTRITASVVPLPAAIWLFASVLLGLLGIQRRQWRG